MMEVNGLILRAGARTLAQDIAFRAEDGECILVAGPNGCGKTTLLKHLARTVENSVFIPTGIPRIKGFTLEEFVRTGCFRESNWAGLLNPGMSQRVDRALARMGLEDRRGQDISTLSDGEFQKAGIAIALARNARVLLLDEPTAFLDADGRISVLRTIGQAARENGITVLFSSHDLHDALGIADRVLAFTPAGVRVSTPENRAAVLSLAFPLYQEVQHKII